MTVGPISDRVRRFLLTSIPAVPHLEALLLLRRERRDWRAGEIAARLYLPEDRARMILADLCAAGIIHCDADQHAFAFAPRSAQDDDLVAELDATYARHLLEVTRLIHSRIERTAQQFADAFRWRKDP